MIADVEYRCECGFAGPVEQLNESPRPLDRDIQPDEELYCPSCSTNWENMNEVTKLCNIVKEIVNGTRTRP